MITIVDYGMGNVGSIRNMFKRIGVESEITGELDKVAAARKLLLPGVGAFDAAVSKIREAGLHEVLSRRVLTDKIPVLGICLGMQLLTNSSEEGSLPGFGWIPGKTVRFSFGTQTGLKVPHMGWNEIEPVRSHPLIENLPPDSRFYYVHSYFVNAEKREHVVATSTHGIVFDSIICRENIYGAQFHPEKSHKYGMILLENFARI